MSRSAVARIVELERRCAELEQSVADANAVVNGLANSAQALSDAVLDAMARQEKQLEQLSTKLTELRALDDQQRSGVVPLVRRVN